MTGKRNIAARAGRWSAAHRKTAIFGWLAFVIAAFAIGGAVGTKHIDSLRRRQRRIRARRQGARARSFEQPAGERVLVQAARRTGTIRRSGAGARDVSARLSANPDVTGLRKPALSRDGRSAARGVPREGQPGSGQRSASLRPSPRRAPRSGPIRACASSRPATPAPSARSRRAWRTTSAGRRRCRCRSRS